MKKSFKPFILLSLLTLISLARTTHAPPDMTLAVVNMGKTDFPRNWTAGTPRWIDTNTFLFYTNETVKNDTFCVGINTQGTVDLYAWQFKLWFNATLLNCTGILKPDYWIYAGYPHLDVMPIINNTAGYIIYGASLLSGPGFSGNGTLCQVGFQITKETTSETASLECELTLDIHETYHLDSNLADIIAQYIHGHFQYVYAQPNIAVRKLEAAKTVVGEGYSVKINATAANQGSNTEEFSLTVYADSDIIAFIENVTLTRGTSTTFTFNWNTTNFAKGSYTIKAHATSVPGETHLIDNNLTNGWIIIAMVGDITGIIGLPDGQCDMRDVNLVATKFSKLHSDPEYDANCDITGWITDTSDGRINMRDVSLIARHFGETDP